MNARTKLNGSATKYRPTSLETSMHEPSYANSGHRNKDMLEIMVKNISLGNILMPKKSLQQYQKIEHRQTASCYYCASLKVTRYKMECFLQRVYLLIYGSYCHSLICMYGFHICNEDITLKTSSKTF